MASYAGSMLNAIGRLSLVAARQILLVLLAALVLACVLAGLSYYLLRAHPGFGILAAGLSVVECLVCGVVVGIKRATIMATSEGLRTSGLGKLGVGLIFDRLLGVADGRTPDNKGQIVQATEKIPLAQAERRLNEAVSTVLRTDLNAPSQTGWFRGLIQARLMAVIAKFTLRRFRADDAQSGGVDLLKVRGELENTVDDVLPSRLQRNTHRLTMLVFAGLVLAVVAQAFVLRLIAGMDFSIGATPLVK